MKVKDLLPPTADPHRCEETLRRTPVRHDPLVGKSGTSLVSYTEQWVAEVSL